MVRNLIGVIAAFLSVAVYVAGDDGKISDGKTRPPDLVLVTFDTTRRDAVGAFGGAQGFTPNLDRLAETGMRYGRAVAPSPLTLPSHATLLTGLDPPQHGVRTNGTSVLTDSMPTLAELLRAVGYRTGAFVGSRVLDRRFGLDRGFSTYGDTMLAERVGEYGYPERRADAVVDEALGWLSSVPASDPFFLWVHFYDPHAPYQPPAQFAGESVLDNYLGEVAFADREMGRLLDAVRSRSDRIVVAAVADHGEALGDHGERTHGIFVYSPTIEVPLVIAGHGVPAGVSVDEPVALRRLAATLLKLLGTGDAAELPGPALPGFTSEPSPAEPAYSEAMMPSAVYGWAPLHAVTWGRLRYIDAPRIELYDLQADPGETTNLVDSRPAEVEQLASMLERLKSQPGPRAADAPDLDPKMRAALEALGYVEGGSTGANDGIDPKDGIGLLAQFERAKTLLAAAQAEKATEILEGLVGKNPSNLPFNNRLAEAQLAAGRGEDAVATLDRALALAPTSVFVKLALANTLLALDRPKEAEQRYREAIAIDPRSAPSWLGLAALAPGPDAERKVLAKAMDAGVESLLVTLRNAQLAREAGEIDEADSLLDRAEKMAPGTAAVTLERARLFEAERRWDDALKACGLAADIDPTNAHTALCSGRVYLAMDQPARARPHLLRATVLGKGTSVEEEARKLMDSISE